MMTMIETITATGLAGYALGTLLAQSHIAAPLRTAFRRVAHRLPLVGRHATCHDGIFLAIHDDDLPARDWDGYDVITCRLCLSVWIAAGLHFTPGPIVAAIAPVGLIIALNRFDIGNLRHAS